MTGGIFAGFFFFSLASCNFQIPVVYCIGRKNADKHGKRVEGDMAYDGFDQGAVCAPCDD